MSPICITPKAEQAPLSRRSMEPDLHQGRQHLAQPAADFFVAKAWSFMRQWRSALVRPIRSILVRTDCIGGPSRGLTTLLLARRRSLLIHRARPFRSAQSVSRPRATEFALWVWTMVRFGPRPVVPQHWPM